MAIGADGRWQLGIGDPTMGGWVTVIAYSAAAALAFRSFRRHWKAIKAEPSTTDQRALVSFWFLAFSATVVLGVNKQLDLQSWLTELGRDLALAQGWYEQRRWVQEIFVAGLVVLGFAGIAIAAILLRRVIRRVAGALLGLGLLATFVAVRATSFHHVDLWLGHGVVRLNWALELSGIALVAWSAWRQQVGTARRANAATT